MTDNVRDNLVFAAFLALIVIVESISRFSLIGAGIALFSVVMLFLTAFFILKDKSVIEKCDLYFGFTALGIISSFYEKFVDSYTLDVLDDDIGSIIGSSIIALVVAIVLNIVLGKIFKAKGNGMRMGTKNVVCYIVSYLAFIISFHNDLFLSDVVKIGVFALVYILMYTSLEETTVLPIHSRSNKFAVLGVILMIASDVFFPDFLASEYSYLYFVKLVVLPWYVVLVAIIGLIVCIGVTAYTNYEEVSPAILLYTTLLGVVVVTKAVTAYPFTYGFAAVIIFFIINRIMVRSHINSKDYSTILDLSLKENPVLAQLLLIIASYLAIVFIHDGLIFLALALIASVAMIAFIPRIFSGWVHDAVHWITIVVSIALVGCSLMVREGFGQKKLTLVIGITIFTVVTMFAMNHKNDVGYNKYTIGKSFITVLFTILILVCVYKGGTSIEIKSIDEEDVVVKIASDIRRGKVSEVEFDHTNSIITSGDTMPITGDLTASIIVPIGDYHHVLIYATDNNGIVSQFDTWYFSTSVYDEADYHRNVEYVNVEEDISEEIEED